VKTERLLLLFAVVSVYGCRCDKPIGTSKPDFVPMPTALNFNACPQLDETGMPVKDVFPDRQTVSILNDGKVSGNLELSLANADAGFSIDPMVPSTISAGDSVDVNVFFSPQKKGDVMGTLTIDDGDPDTMPVTVGLIGTGINLPAQPTVEAALQSAADAGDYSQVCTGLPGEPTADCIQNYPDTVLGDTWTMQMKLRNTGCPTLKVTGIDIVENAGDDDTAFFLDAPVPPTMDNPILMSQADGTNEIVLTIRFSPHASATNMDTQRFAFITVTTNDPVTPMLQLQVEGQAVIPSIYAEPTFCNFADPAGGCADGGVANFLIGNSGSSALTIGSATFKSSGMSSGSSDGRFTVAMPVDGTVLMPGDTKILSVTHHDASLFVIDQIAVTANPASAGKVTLTVEGGTEPCLGTDPVDTLEFLDAGNGAKQTVAVKALTMHPTTGRACGALTVNDVQMIDPTFFKVVAPFIDAGTTIMPGSQALVTVQYTKPVTGGRQATNMLIKTNDPDYGDPAWKSLLIESNAPLNQYPVAVVKACIPDCSGMCFNDMMTVHLSTDFPGGMKQVEICGGDSYDPGNPNMPGISTYTFALGSMHPAMSTLDNNGVAIMTNHTTLHLNPTVVGTYKVLLKVTDDTNQPSGANAQVQINVYQ
jgi:hypothetical protein